MSKFVKGHGIKHSDKFWLINTVGQQSEVIQTVSVSLFSHCVFGIVGLPVLSLIFFALLSVVLGPFVSTPLFLHIFGETSVV